MTVENFKKAMERASLELLYNTKQNLMNSSDKERLEIVESLIAEQESKLKNNSKPVEETKPRGKK